MIEEEQTHRNFLRRDRENRCFMTFPNTTEAIKMEAACHGAGLLGRLVPVPGEITAGCGLAWKAPVEAESQLLSAMTDAGMHWQETRVLELWV